jgi:hypothetical protein
MVVMHKPPNRTAVLCVGSQSNMLPVNIEPWKLLMNEIKTSKEIDRRRRLFVGTAALTVAAAQLGTIGAAVAQRGKTKLPSVKPGSHTSFGRLKQIDAGLLNVGYAEAGPANGPPVLLLHGWPYDIYSFVDVTPLLASARYRVIAPRRAFSQARRSATASRLRSPSISSP